MKQYISNKAAVRDLDTLGVGERIEVAGREFGVDLVGNTKVLRLAGWGYSAELPEQNRSDRVFGRSNAKNKRGMSLR